MTRRATFTAADMARLEQLAALAQRTGQAVSWEAGGKRLVATPPAALPLPDSAADRWFREHGDDQG